MKHLNKSHHKVLKLQVALLKIQMSLLLVKMRVPKLTKAQSLGIEIWTEQQFVDKQNELNS